MEWKKYKTNCASSLNSGKSDKSEPAKRKNTDLPAFFMAYDDASFAQEHLMKLDPLQPSKVTHFCAVPLQDVASLKASPTYNESEVFWKLEDMTCDQLSKLLTQLGASRNGMKKADMIKTIDAIEKESVDWSALKDSKNVNNTVANMNGNKIVFRVINVLFNALFFEKFVSLNDNYDRKTHELYNTDMFFTDVSNAVNDNGSPIHSTLLPCGDPTFESQYNLYISPARIPSEELPCGTLTHLSTAKLCKQIYTDLVNIRKKMMTFMTQSGTHDGEINPFKYVVHATKKPTCDLSTLP